MFEILSWGQCKPDDMYKALEGSTWRAHRFVSAAHIALLRILLETADPVEDLDLQTKVVLTSSLLLPSHHHHSVPVSSSFPSSNRLTHQLSISSHL